MDVGGTSADIAFVQDGKALEVTDGELVGHQIYVPMLDLVTVGAGGGTLCRGTDHGRLLVGPNSAGADPGPACYGKGGVVATITDADLVLGLLDPEYYLGGRMALDPGAAAAAVQTSIARPLGLTEVTAATSAAQLNEVHMADAIKVLAAQRGVDVTATTLVACGGAGPLHACGVADELGIQSVLVPKYPGAFSAVGLLSSDVVQDFVQTLITTLEPANEAEIDNHFSALEQRARAALAEQGFGADDIEMHREIDARYAGQGFELRLSVAQSADVALALAQNFHDEHTRVYGHAAPDEAVEIVSYRVRAVVRMPALDIAFASESTDDERTAPSTRSVFFANAWIEARAVRRDHLATGAPIAGPLIVEQPDTTTFVPPAWTLELDKYGNIVLAKGSAE
jgi:N-methylhydantoinase A